MKPRQLISRSGDGFELRLSVDERDVLGRLLAELRSLVSADPSSAAAPAVARLFPPAHADRPADEEEYQRLMRDELVASRLTGIETVEAAFAGALTSGLRSRRSVRVPMTEQQVLAFMQAVNGVRLVLGTVLDLRDDDNGDGAEEAVDPELLPEYQLYGFLSWALDSAVDALSPDLGR